MLISDLIIGIDLSFNSTGITISYFEDKVSKKISFHRLVYQKKPHPITNINQHTYILPTNISVKDLIVDDTDITGDLYTEDQAELTLRAMIVCKRIIGILLEHINQYKPNNVIVNIEGFIMPSITGTNQLRVIGGLIMMQGLIRSEIIKFKLTESLSLSSVKLYITSPSELKLFFTGNGNADKQLMLDTFINNFNGSKLLPDTTSLAKVNDVIDSFALMMYAWYRINGGVIKSKKQSKLSKVKKTKSKTKKSESPIII